MTWRSTVTNSGGILIGSSGGAFNNSLVLDGFSTLSARLRELDGQDTLRERLQRFESCQVRVIVRATETYAELTRMLWHPVSLHDEATLGF